MRPETELWWKQANEDLVTARVNLYARRYYACVFFAHQAAEKALKALFIETMRELPTKTHNLIALGTALESPEEIMTSVRDLGPEYITSRYPDAAYGAPAELYDEKLASVHLVQAEEIVAWVKQKLK
ncbi:MAG: HEPN domain-containing protein [Actinobacteria bacterium]|nr:HEPN domain-containing protein [Actinomycetota bacterium]